MVKWLVWTESSSGCGKRGVGQCRGYRGLGRTLQAWHVGEYCKTPKKDLAKIVSPAQTRSLVVVVVMVVIVVVMLVTLMVTIIAMVGESRVPLCSIWR